MQKIIANLYTLLALLLPLIFLHRSSEVFELPKITIVYIFTILIVALWMIRIIVERKIIFIRTLLDLPLLVFLVTQMMSTSTSIDLLTSIQGYYSRFYGGLLSLAAFSLLYWAGVSNLQKKDIKRIINSLIISGVIVSVWAILEKMGYSPSCLLVNGKLEATCWAQKVQERPFATLGQPNWLAAYLAMVSPLIWMRANSTRRKLLYYSIAIITFAAILFTRSRSGLLGFSIAFVVYWFYELIRFRDEIVNSKLFAVFSASFIALGVIVNPLSIHSPEDLDPTVTSSVDIRVLLWQGALDIWKDNPVLGTGPETFAYSYYQYRPLVHNFTSEWNFVYNKAHNEYLNYLANTGLLGLGSYIALVVFSIRQINKNNSHLLAGYIALLVANFFSFTTVPVGLLFFLYPAIAIVNNKSTFKNLKISAKAQQVTKIAVLVIAGCLLFITGKFFYSDLLYAKNNYVDTNRATQLSPYQPMYWEKLGMVLAEADSDVLADNALQQAVVQAPRNVKLQKNIAQQYIIIGQVDDKYYDKALQILEPLQKYAPTDPMLPYLQALAEMNRNEDRARELLSKTLLMRPQYREAQEAFLLIEAGN